MMYRNISSIASIMLLILLPHLSNARMSGTGTSGERDLQAQPHQGEDELWEAKFMEDRRALVSAFSSDIQHVYLMSSLTHHIKL